MTAHCAVAARGFHPFEIIYISCKWLGSRAYGQSAGITAVADGNGNGVKNSVGNSDGLGIAVHADATPARALRVDD